MKSPLEPELLESLKRLDTCTVSNAIETFNVRMHNEGFMDGSIRCFFPNRPATLGYAITARIHTSNPPVKGRSYADRTDWWNHILTMPEPRMVVIQDADETPAFGSFLGEIHANILHALGAVAVVTNGAVRDLAALNDCGLQIFAARSAVSHAYAHLIEFGRPVEVAGLKIAPGDLLHADMNGVVSIPKDVAAEIPRVASDLLDRERRVVAICRSSEFAVEKLRDAVHGIFPDDPTSPGVEPS